MANWFYYRNDRSIVAGAFFHSMLNGAAVLLSAGQPAKCIANLVLLLVAIGLIARDRATFSAGPATFLDRR